MSKVKLFHDEVKKLKTLLKTAFEDIPEKVEEQFDSLPDGKVGTTKIDTFEIGGKVELVNVDGTIGVAPDGEYSHDATSQTYTVKAGFITSINTEEAKVAASAEEEKPDAFAIQVAEFKTQLDAQALAITALTEAFAAMKTSIEAQVTADEKLSAQFTAQFTDLNTALKTIAKIPVEDSKITNKNVVADDKEQKLKDLAFLLNK